MKDDPLFRELPDSFDERVPQAVPPQPRVRRWDVAFSVLSGLAGSAFILMRIVPKFGEMFRQVKVPMPSLTLMVMNLSDLACYCPILTAFLITVLTASVHAWHPRAIAIGRYLLPLVNALVWGGMAFALFLPMMCCSLSIGSKKSY